MPFLFYPTCSLSLSSFFFSFLFCFVFRLWLGPPTSLFPTETHFFEKENKTESNAKASKYYFNRFSLSLFCLKRSQANCITERTKLLRPSLFFFLLRPHCFDSVTGYTRERKKNVSFVSFVFSLFFSFIVIFGLFGDFKRESTMEGVAWRCLSLVLRAPYQGAALMAPLSFVE